MKNSVFAVMVLFGLAACDRDASREGRRTGHLAPAPAPAMTPGSTGPREARPLAVPPEGCQDPQVVKAFESLRSCNYRQGVLDYQCAALKALGTALRDRVKESRARVQLTLERLLSHPEERIRQAVAKRLSPYSDQRSVLRRLVQAYRSERSPYVRAWLVYGLRQTLPEALAVITTAVRKDPSPAVRARAALRLGSPEFTRTPAARDALAQAVQKDKDVLVRQQAAEALGRYPRIEATEKILLSCLGDKHLGPHCAFGLAQMRSRPGYEALWKRLQAPTAGRVLHPLYVWALVKFVGAAFVDHPAILRYLSRIAQEIKAQTGVRHFAIRGLGQLARTVPAHRAAVLAVLKRLQRDKSVGVSVNNALTRLEGSPTVRGPNRAGNPMRP